MLKRGLRSLVVLVVCLAVLDHFTGLVAAEELLGEEILAKVDAGMKSNSKTMNQKMTLINSSGQERVRELTVKNKRTESDDLMLVRFLAPADVRGTGLLMANEDMWLYLPALGRVRRIAGHAKKGSFMGSDLSYEDMEQFGSTGFGIAYTAKLMGKDPKRGNAYKLELTPKGESGEYRSLLMWVDKEKWVPTRIEYFDMDGVLQKVLSTENLEQLDNRWVARKIEMENVQRGTRTILEVTEVHFDISIPDSEFTSRNLERGL